MGDLVRAWIFSVEGLDDGNYYLDVNGQQINEDTAKENPYHANSSEAASEADRRADLWENYYNRWAAKVTYHSCGAITK